ncbi:hypothetical protein PFICI_12347 [Pestalotiopsis fici W106-1]|uniref:Uncharacterized protein n=1 Tax=Pestalotiopsis fici (strain W106-1 / CGMCC3.15140) TaxID=1229662 RepID=W3WNH0_PESFW|nr:uncharacterized protein PFICI_12347 [Pestalotiopsis fici W106-1]ETS75403.1 hypothetical protein PFICI_12347 [Pestalotiopsis fici W106-1]
MKWFGRGGRFADLENTDMSNIVKALKSSYPDYKPSTMARAFSKVINLVSEHIQECGELSVEQFFDKYKTEVSWAKSLSTKAISGLFRAAISSRMVLKNLLKDLPVYGPNAPPKRAWLTNCLTDAIDGLHMTFINGYSRTSPEVLWDWGFKDGEDTEFGDSDVEKLSQVDEAESDHERDDSFTNEQDNVSIDGDGGSDSWT